MEDTFFFDWTRCLARDKTTNAADLLNWLRQNPEQNADGMNLLAVVASAWPLLKLHLGLRGAGSVSHVNARTWRGRVMGTCST